MFQTSEFRIFRPGVVALALVALLALGCGDKSPEELLAEATEELGAATQAKEAAQGSLDQLDDRLEKAQSARDTAFEAFEEARIRWETAKDAVGEFATDDVLHRQVNQALLDASDLEGTTVQARVRNRVVTLIGVAGSQDAIDTAVELSTAVPGVSRVSSQVVIGSVQQQNGAETAPADEEAAWPTPPPKSAPAAEEEPVQETEEAAEPADESAAPKLDDAIEEGSEVVEEYEEQVVPGPDSDWNPETDPMSEESETPLERQI